MPVEVIKYLCSYRCGTKAKSTLVQITYHEKICFKNPERRACTTCKHEQYEKDYLGDGSGPAVMARGCNALSEEQYQQIWNACEFHSKPVFHVQPVFNCPHWESKK